MGLNHEWILDRSRSWLDINDDFHVDQLPGGEAKTMNKIQAGRLLTLAWFLRTQVPKRNFDMESYAEGKNCDLRQLNCGTSACALGWSTVVFPEDFRLVPDVSFGQAYYRVFGKDGEIDFYDEGPRRFFGINEDESIKLFGPTKRDPEREARMIEKVVRKNGWEYA